MNIAPALYTSAKQEWLTPPHIITAVLATLGTIDLDPCSNSEGPPNVPAITHYTKADEGLRWGWAGRVFMNPPYDNTLAWVTQLINYYSLGEVTEAVLLVPARTDTKWFQQLSPYPVCFIRGRLRFSGSANSAPFPSAVFYFGFSPERFADAFVPYGPIYRAVGA